MQEAFANDVANLRCPDGVLHHRSASFAVSKLWSLKAVTSSQIPSGGEPLELSCRRAISSTVITVIIQISNAKSLPRASSDRRLLGNIGGNTVCGFHTKAANLPIDEFPITTTESTLSN